MEPGAVSCWDTSHLPIASRYAAWQQMLTATCGSWEVEKSGSCDFQASMVHQAIGNLQIAQCICDPCGGSRSHSDIARDGTEALTIQLVLAGKERFTIEEKQTLLTPGDIVIWDSIRSMRFEVVERLTKLSVTIPLMRLRSWLPHSWHSIRNSLPHVSPSTGLLSTFMQGLTGTVSSNAACNADALTEALLGLLVNALGDEMSDRDVGSIRRQQLIAVKRYIDANLDDPGLSLDSVAAGVRISIRYLHALFREEPTTVQPFIINRRLEQCYRDLCNPAMNHRTVTDIAFSWGFQNSAHFGRRFKLAFSYSPTDFREQQKGLQTRFNNA